MMKMKLAGLIGLVAVIMIIIAPASAVILEETYKGSISRIESSKDTINVYVTDVYQGDGSWLDYGQSSLPNPIVTATFNNPAAFADLKQGDPVEVTLLGGSEWITIGKIGSVSATSQPIIACYGDPSRLVSPFYNNYEITFVAEPDCALCEGTTCTASLASVNVKRDGTEVEAADMFPGSTHVFAWNSDYQYIPVITFVSGEAGSSPCLSSDIIMAGPQAISDFTIYITQRSTIVKSVVETLETEEVTEAPTPVSPTAVMTVEETTVQTAAPSAAPTQAPGFTLFIALAGIFAALCVFSYRK